jgi:hypothetical protein
MQFAPVVATAPRPRIFVCRAVSKPIPITRPKTPTRALMADKSLLAALN